MFLVTFAMYLRHGCLCGSLTLGAYSLQVLGGPPPVLIKDRVGPVLWGPALWKAGISRCVSAVKWSGGCWVGWGQWRSWWAFPHGTMR